MICDWTHVVGKFHRAFQCLLSRTSTHTEEPGRTVPQCPPDNSLGKVLERPLSGTRKWHVAGILRRCWQYEWSPSRVVAPRLTTALLWFVLVPLLFCFLIPWVSERMWGAGYHICNHVQSLSITYIPTFIHAQGLEDLAWLVTVHFKQRAWCKTFLDLLSFAPIPVWN